MARILVVDDNRDVCKALTRLVKHLGHEGHFASSGPEALHFVQQQLPDLIILDVMMPDMDGMTVLHKLKQDQRTQGLPVVMFSAITDETFRNNAIERGAADYWIKAAVNFDDLGHRLDKLLNISAHY